MKLVIFGGLREFGGVICAAETEKSVRLKVPKLPILFKSREVRRSVPKRLPFNLGLVISGMI